MSFGFHAGTNHRYGLDLTDPDSFFFTQKFSSFPWAYNPATKTLAMFDGFDVHGVDASGSITSKSRPETTATHFYALGPKQDQYFAIRKDVKVSGVTYREMDFYVFFDRKVDYTSLWQKQLSTFVDWGSPVDFQGHRSADDVIASRSTLVNSERKSNSFGLYGGSNEFVGTAAYDVVVLTPSAGDQNRIVGGSGDDHVRYFMPDADAAATLVINGGFSGRAKGDSVSGFEWYEINDFARFDIRVGRLDGKDRTEGATVHIEEGQGTLIASNRDDDVSLMFDVTASTVYLNDGHDRIGTAGHRDRIDGGKGKDVIELWGAIAKRKVVYLGDVTKPLDKNAFEFRIDVTDRDGDKRTHSIKNVEYLFAGVEKGKDIVAPLVKWHFVIDRKQDGDCTVQLFENGVSKFRVKGYYDDATPIPMKKKGFYEGWYRPDGKLGKVIQFETLGDPVRKNIQIHGGDDIKFSEGCFTIALPHIDTMRNLMDAAFKGTGLKPVKGKGYDIPVPITIDVRNQVKQPKLNFAENDVTASNGVIAFPIKLSQYGEKKGITRKLDLHFEIKQGAGYAKLGKDFEVVGTTSKKFTMTLGPGQIEVPLKFKLLGKGDGPQRKVAVEIYDMDIFRPRFDKETGSPWTMYDESKKSKGTLSSPEKLLLGEKTFEFLIGKSPGNGAAGGFVAAAQAGYVYGEDAGALLEQQQFAAVPDGELFA